MMTTMTMIERNNGITTYKATAAPAGVFDAAINT